MENKKYYGGVALFLMQQKEKIKEADKHEPRF
jgi:hypothetical protein